MLNSYHPLPLASSYNQPKFCSNASWRTNGTTFVDNSTIHKGTYDIFVDRNNTVYVANKWNSSIQIWSKGNSTPTRTITMDSHYPHSLFVTSNGDVYTDVTCTNRIERWTQNASNATLIMTTGGSCFSIFIDINDTIYCSLYHQHKIMARSMTSHQTSGIDFVGRDCPGITSDMLYGPWGIFVDLHLNLFVADSGNDRIQKFVPGQKNARTVAGMGASNTIQLFGPTGIQLDADGYLFIVDKWKNRIVRSGPNGFYCIVACSDGPDMAPHRLNSPTTMRFDNQGNIYVMDTNNNRTQLFTLATGSCGKK